MKVTEYISEEQIQKTVNEISEKINAFYKGEEIILCVIMKGSLVFAADLMRRLDMPLRLEFMRAQSYGSSSSSSGNVHITCDADCDFAEKNVLIVEDIIDTGNTLFALKKLLQNRKPKTLKLCTLLDKPSRRTVDLSADFSGITIPDEFVVGYGLDYNEQFRQLPYIGILSL